MTGLCTKKSNEIMAFLKLKHDYGESIIFSLSSNIILTLWQLHGHAIQVSYYMQSDLSFLAHHYKITTQQQSSLVGVSRKLESWLLLWLFVSPPFSSASHHNEMTRRRDAYCSDCFPRYQVCAIRVLITLIYYFVIARFIIHHRVRSVG